MTKITGDFCRSFALAVTALTMQMEGRSSNRKTIFAAGNVVFFRFYEWVAVRAISVRTSRVSFCINSLDVWLILASLLKNAWDALAALRVQMVSAQFARKEMWLHFNTRKKQWNNLYRPENVCLPKLMDYFVCLANIFRHSRAHCTQSVQRNTQRCYFYRVSKLLFYTCLIRFQF